MPMSPSVAYSFTRRDMVISLLVIALALIYRLQIIVDRAEGDAIAFDPLPVGADQTYYYNSIADFASGKFPPQKFFFQPGMSYLLIAVSTIMRTTNLGALRVFLAAIASINCGFMIAAARLATGRRSVAIVSGLMLAFYPVSAFFDTDFVITSQATVLITLLLFSVCLLWCFPRNWTGAVLAGLSIGALALMRRELIAVGIILGLWLLWQQRHSRTLLQIGLAALIAVVCVLPVALHNRAGGADYLLTPAGEIEIYRGNNRDAYGDNRNNQASSTTTTDYLHYLVKDIQLEPVRFIELEIHKVGMYLSAREPANNLSYVNSGRDVSPVLQLNPLNFPILIALFLYGLYGLHRARAGAFWLLGLSFLVIMASTLLIWVEARIRTPVIAVLVIGAAFGIVDAATQIRALLTGTTDRRALRPLLMPLLPIAVLLVAGQWAEDYLPNRLIDTSLPDSAQKLDATYDDTLKLLGWQVESAYSPAQVIEPYRPYVITLYWQLEKPTSTDYIFSLAYLIDGHRVMAFDHPIGTVAAPERMTSQWTPGAIYVEHLALAYQQADGPFETTGGLFLSVYPNGRADAPIPAAGLPESPLSILLAQPAIMPVSSHFDRITPQPTSVSFDDQLLLRGWSYPTSAAVNSTVDVTLGWQRTDRPLNDSYSIGVHLYDEAGTFITQDDNPPHAGRLLTWSLPPAYIFEDTKTLTMPAAPGDYHLWVVIYDSLTGQRLPVPNTNDNLYPLGIITVQ
ncbi:MAG: hypothetical protein R3E39_28535 [Anaerolineae bacterium]